MAQWLAGIGKREEKRGLVSDGTCLANLGAVAYLVLAEGADTRVVHAIGCEDPNIRISHGRTAVLAGGHALSDEFWTCHISFLSADEYGRCVSVSNM